MEAALRAAIRDGTLAAGTRLPSSRDLAGQLGVARGTVTAAYAQLVAEGYLTAKRGSGTTVAAVRGLSRTRPRCGRRGGGGSTCDRGCPR
ncbi:GntR family transcriptional regulator [Actinokineospora soli]|uniref:GntR family transcriptional regulator n=1 Tax=Actinokineospora soli TaxID=1048753 RepID=A0ABW2TIR2_9PSEU